MHCAGAGGGPWRWRGVAWRGVAWHGMWRWMDGGDGMMGCDVGDIMGCHAMPCDAMLSCDVMSCHAMPCHVIMMRLGSRA